MEKSSSFFFFFSVYEVRIRLYKALLIDGDCKSVGMAVLMAEDYKSPEHKEVGTFLTTDCKSVETPNGIDAKSFR